MERQTAVNVMRKGTDLWEANGQNTKLLAAGFVGDTVQRTTENSLYNPTTAGKGDFSVRGIAAHDRSIDWLIAAAVMFMIKIKKF
jgi:hypothetical protein